MASGVTSGTGELPVVNGSRFQMSLRFGEGSVDLEQQMPSGEWIKLQTGITDDYSQIFDGVTPSWLRFNVTDHTTAIEWSLDAI